MNTRKSRKNAVREYKKDTFKGYQEEKVGGCEEAIHNILVLLGKSNIKFKNITQLAEHISGTLKREGKPRTVSALTRNHHIKAGAKVPNPYRLLLLKYGMSKYFEGKNLKVTAEDVEEIRKRETAVDVYCAGLEGTIGIRENEIKLKDKEIASLQESKALPQGANTNKELSSQLNKTCTALKRLVDAFHEFVAIDWKQRTIVDLAPIIPKPIVETDLLDAFFKALENSGIKPPENTYDQ